MCKTFNQDEINDFIRKELDKQNNPLDMIYLGFSSHDCEAWYRCPKCDETYGSWSFFNGGIITTDGKFKCKKCGTILKVPE